MNCVKRVIVIYILRLGTPIVLRNVCRTCATFICLQRRKHHGMGNRASTENSVVGTSEDPQTSPRMESERKVENFIWKDLHPNGILPRWLVAENVAADWTRYVSGTHWTRNGVQDRRLGTRCDSGENREKHDVRVSIRRRVIERRNVIVSKEGVCLFSGAALVCIWLSFAMRLERKDSLHFETRARNERTRVGQPCGACRVQIIVR